MAYSVRAARRRHTGGELISQINGGEKGKRVLCPDWLVNAKGG
jgi:hypothetical protein